MDTTNYFPAWRERIRYTGPGPEPTILHDDPGARAILVGLEPGGRVPAHPERLGIYHILEGSGSMTVDGERYPLTAGATVIAPAGSTRGIEAETRLAFLAVRVGSEPTSGR
ncbi:MAG: cupin domain-containing protein [Chloroflexota bacterium]